MLHLVTFGGLALESVNEAVAPRLSAQRLAILAVLAAEGDRRVSRERLTGLFWPDADEERARHSLRQALYTLRQEVGREVLRSESLLSLDGAAITSDVGAFRVALARGEREAATKLMRAPFLDAFYLPGAAPFQRWVEEERARIHSAVASALTSLATEATFANDLDAAVGWWRRLSELDPLSGRFALGHLRALAARGDRAEALAFARSHAALVRRELDADADPEVLRLEASLRAAPAPPIAVEASGRAEAVPRLPESAGPAVPRSDGVRDSGRWTLRRLTRHMVAAGFIAAAVVVAARLAGWPLAERAGASVTAAPLTVPPADIGTHSATAYRLYQEGVRAYYGGDWEASARLMRAALDDDSTFAMAAYYDAIATDDGPSFTLERRALRLAARSPERVRLLITTAMLTLMQSPSAVTVAESLGTRYPDDREALAAVAKVRHSIGDWPGAVRALERAVAIDSASARPNAPCHLCDDLSALAAVHYLSDSLAAAADVGRRFVRLLPSSYGGWDILAWSAVKVGDTASAARALRRGTELAPAQRNAPREVRYTLLMDKYATTLEDVRPLLESPKAGDIGFGRWWLLIALRNQGRLRDARTFNETGRLPGLPAPLASQPGPDEINAALVSLESGDPRAAVAAFTRQRQRTDTTGWPDGYAARSLTWNRTLTGMALAAAGDTTAVRLLADTVEVLGRRSLYGRDARLHHYLRGLVDIAGGRDDDAIRELERAIYSPTLGFTRVNFELGRALLRRGRPQEAVAAVAPALRGEIDASNLYVTRTELHELLAQAFDRAGKTDSAAVHYRVVASSWANADERFRARCKAARDWLARWSRTDDR